MAMVIVMRLLLLLLLRAVHFSGRHASPNHGTGIGRVWRARGAVSSVLLDASVMRHIVWLGRVGRPPSVAEKPTGG